MNADDPLEWSRLAEQDWELAASLLRRKKPVLVHICFHAQQSAEKYLKSLLLSAQLIFPKTHDLATLNQLCESGGILTGFSATYLDFLSEYAVTSRYPGTEPTLEEAREAVEIARAVRKFTRNWLMQSH